MSKTTESKAYKDGQAMGIVILRTSELFYNRNTRKRYLMGLMVSLDVGYTIGEVVRDRKFIDNIAEHMMKLEKFMETHGYPPTSFSSIKQKKRKNAPKCGCLISGCTCQHEPCGHCDYDEAEGELLACCQCAPKHFPKEYSKKKR